MSHGLVIRLWSNNEQDINTHFMNFNYAPVATLTLSS